MDASRASAAKLFTKVIDAALCVQRPVIFITVSPSIINASKADSDGHIC